MATKGGFPISDIKRNIRQKLIKYLVTTQNFIQAWIRVRLDQKVGPHPFIEEKWNR
jgi:hypothetical protein